MSLPVTWTAEHDAALHTMLTEGISRRRAAVELNDKFGTDYSGNAVIGRAYRQRFPVVKAISTAPKPEPKIKRKAKATPAQKRGLGVGLTMSQPKLPTQPSQLRCDPLKAGTFHVTELEEGMCRWPSGEGTEITFCGLNQVEGMPYCRSHCAIAFQPARPITRPSFQHRGRA